MKRRILQLWQGMLTCMRLSDSYMYKVLLSLFNNIDWRPMKNNYYYCTWVWFLFFIHVLPCQVYCNVILTTAFFFRTTTLTEELGQIQYIFSDKVTFLLITVGAPSEVQVCWILKILAIILLMVVPMVIIV